MPTTAAIGGYMSYEEEDTCHMRRRIHAHHCSHKFLRVTMIAQFVAPSVSLYIYYI